MKKTLALVMVLFLVVSCTAKQEDEQTKEGEAKEELKQSQKEISDYYPFLQDTKLIYAGRGNEFAGREIYFDFVQDRQGQLREDSGGTTLAQTLEIQDGEVRRLRSQEGFNYWHRLEIKDKKNYEILLKEPLKVGTSWELSDGRQRYISAKDVEVKTPSGNYKTLEVTTEGDDYQHLDYYAEGIGLVLSKYQSGEVVIKTLLAEIKQDSVVRHRVKFFYPDFKAEEEKYIPRQVEFKTNQSAAEVFTKELQKEPPQGLTPVISQNTKINSIDLKRTDNLVKVDFSREMLTDMNAGHLLESLIIQSLVNTFGEYYRVDKVYLSLEGEPYQSGHMMIKEGDYFKVEGQNNKYQR